ARQQELNELHQRVERAEAEHAAGQKVHAAAAGAFDKQLQTVIAERAAALENDLADAQARGHADTEALRSAVAARQPPLQTAVNKLYAAEQAKRQKVFDKADAQTARVRVEAAKLQEDAQKQEETAQAAVEKSRADFAVREAEVEVRTTGHLDESIKKAKQD